ncbi:hypothetical protein pb186bvf_001653 [Paramecium bursaria]
MNLAIIQIHLYSALDQQQNVLICFYSFLEEFLKIITVMKQHDTRKKFFFNRQSSRQYSNIKIENFNINENDPVNSKQQILIIYMKQKPQSVERILDCYESLLKSQRPLKQCIRVTNKIQKKCDIVLDCQYSRHNEILCCQFLGKNSQPR